MNFNKIFGQKKSEPRECNSSSQSERSVYGAIARRDTGGMPVTLLPHRNQFSEKSQPIMSF